jgi:LacI family transcriptional regulator
MWLFKCLPSGVYLNQPRMRGHMRIEKRSPLMSSLSKPISPKVSKSQQWANELRRRIRDGELQPGDRLPSIVEMKDRHGVSRPVMDRIHALLEKDGVIVREPGRGVFVAQSIAATARAGRTDGVVLGVAMPTVPQHDQYYERMMRGIQAVAHDEKVEIVLFNDLSGVLWEQVDGVVFCSNSDRYFPSIMPLVPSVSLLHTLQARANVVTDDFLSMHRLISHLLELGHRRIAYLTAAVSPAPNPDNFCLTVAALQQRLAGYRQALHTAAIKPEEGWVKPLMLFSERPEVDQYLNCGSHDLGRAAMTNWLADNWRELGCTALAVQNDGAAIGAIEVLQEAGIRVPHDVSVVGFDGLDVGQYFRPRLTTVQVPLEAIGAQGARLLLAQIRGAVQADAAQCGAPDTEVSVLASASMVIPSQLKLGESCAPLRAVNQAAG